MVSLENFAWQGLQSFRECNCKTKVCDLHEEEMCGTTLVLEGSCVGFSVWLGGVAWPLPGESDKNVQTGVEQGMVPVALFRRPGIPVG